MQNLFIDKEEEFTIKFSVAFDEEGKIYCDITRESLLESFKEKIKDSDIKDYEAVFRKPSFGDSVKLYESIFSLTQTSDVNFNPLLARCNKITALIKNWNLQGEKNKPTEEEIKKLNPIIATVIGIQVDAETGSIFG